jgi:hypothetical protein
VPFKVSILYMASSQKFLIQHAQNNSGSWKSRNMRTAAGVLIAGQEACAGKCTMRLNRQPLVFKCPVSGINIISGIRICEGDEVHLPTMTFSIRCPCCKERHDYSGDQSRRRRSAA